MDVHATGRPAWQTDDLAEEWVDDEEQAGTDLNGGEQLKPILDVQKSRRGLESIGISTSTSTLTRQLSEGSISRKSGPGTFVIREDVQAAPILPQTPGKKAIVKDFFSPLALEKMFEPPSPPQSNNVAIQNAVGFKAVIQPHHMAPTKPSKLSQVVNRSVLEEEDEIIETDVPNMVAFGGHKMSTDCQFTFTAPPQNDKMSKIASADHLYSKIHKKELGVGNAPLLPSYSDSNNRLFPESQPQAQSTPIPSSQSDTNVRPPTDPRLRLFQFQYDTFTREHLSAIVDSIGANSSSAEGSTESPLNLYRDSNNTAQNQDISYAHLRSTKRIKLTPPDNDRRRDRIESRNLLRPKYRKDYVGESKSLMQQIKQQARDISLISVVSQIAATSQDNHGQGATPECSRNELGQIKQDAHLQIPELDVPRPSSAASTFASGGSKTNSYSSLTYRRQAADLMAQIKSDMKGSKRLFSDQTEQASLEEITYHRRTSSKIKAGGIFINQHSAPQSVSDGAKLGTEQTKALDDESHRTGVYHITEEKENRQPLAKQPERQFQSQQQTVFLSSALPSSTKPHLSSSKPQNNLESEVDVGWRYDSAPSATVLRKSRGGATPTVALQGQILDSVMTETNQRAGNTAAATKVVEVLTEVGNTTNNTNGAGGVSSSSSRVFHRHSPNPTFLAPSTGRGGNIRARNDNLNAAVSGTDDNGKGINNGDLDVQQNHHHVTNANEDLNRFVSSSTTATSATGTTLTAGSFIKHPGPAHMVHIAPNDMPSLPERVGKMIFDRDVMRWVKVKDVDVWAVRVAEEKNGMMTRQEADEESEDPFRDIESLRDEESTKQDDMSDADKGLGQEDMSEASLIEESDDEDEEEKGFLTFSFDGPPPGIVEVMTGDSTSDMDTDTDSDNDDDDLEAEAIEMEEDSIIDAEDEDLSQLSASMSLASPHKSSRTHVYSLPSPPQAEHPLPTSSSAPVLVLSTPRATHINTNIPIPNSYSRTALPPPRSALKNTPNSVSFVRYQHQQDGRMTPVRTSSGHRRSVSFSDGKKEGKIVGLEIERRNATIHGHRYATITPSNSGGTVASDNMYNNTPTPGMTTLPSVRTNRIVGMLEEIEEPLVSAEVVNEGERRLRRSSSARMGWTPIPQTQVLSSPNKRRASGMTQNANAIANASTRSPLARSRSFRGPIASASSNPPPYAHPSPNPQHQQPNTSATHPQTQPHVSYSYPSQSHLNQTFLTDCSFGITHDKLVVHLTDVAPFEPHWHTLRALDLSGRKIDSVARLKEFMPRLDRVELNDNLLSYLSGIPSTVRSLAVASNALTSLTSFAHLLRLEHLDISRNDVDSLLPLSCLTHLRELRADANRISSLRGIEELDGLVKLSLKGNLLEGGVELGACKWDQLELLDLSQNKIQSLSGLGALRKVVVINLDNNALASLSLSSKETTDEKQPSTIPTLRILRLSSNKLTALDMGLFPGAKTVYVDENRLAGAQEGKERRGLVNLHKARKLENLSARSQVGGGTLRLEAKDIQDIKRLYLSGNATPLPSLTVPCYHLTYLELAGCRLTSLPDLSSQTPNLRALNVNYNFLTSEDVAGVVGGLSRLKKLSAVGCRMKAKGLKSVVRALRGCGEVESVDFRMNPCTLEWYLPLLVPLEGKGESNWEELDKNFRRGLPDAVYAGRLGYRGIVMGACERLVVMDGVRVGQREREKAGRVIRRAVGK